MSVKERDRLRVVHQVKEGKLTCREAAELLGISARQVRRSLRRLEEEGDPGLVHRLRNRPSNRKIAEEIRRRVLERIQERYGDFGPTLVSEYLESEDRLQVSRETVRGWMIEGVSGPPSSGGPGTGNGVSARPASGSSSRWTCAHLHDR